MATAARMHPAGSPGDIEPSPIGSTGRNQRWARLAAAVFIVAAAAFTALQYRYPRGYNSLFWGLDPLAVDQFAQHLGVRGSRIASPHQWTTDFRLTVGILWSAYALLLATLWRGAKPPRWLPATAVGIALGLAVLCPPLLTTDCYAYVGYARMAHLYGANPYLNTPYVLFRHGDPVMPYLVWDLPTVYGPAWTWLTIAATAVLPAAWLWAQVVAVKLIAAAALVAAAFAARRIAEHFQPGHGRLAFAAVALNPLLLIEGAGNGHSDLLLVALILWSAACFLNRRYGWAGVMLGLAIGVKIVPLALLPWMVIVACRTLSGRSRITAVGALIAGALLPSLVGYASFWHGPAILTPMLERSYYHAGAAALARDTHVRLWLQQHGAPMLLAHMAAAVFQHGPIIGIYALLTLWIGRTRLSGAFLTGWAVLAACLMFLDMGLPFPWYIAWFWTFCLLRWDRVHIALSTASFGLAFVWVSLYASLAPNSWFPN